MVWIEEHFPVLISSCVLISAGIFAVALLRAFLNRHTVSRRITILLAGVCASSFFLFFPGYWRTSFDGTVEGVSYPPLLRSLAYTLYYGLKAISGGQEIDVMETMALESVPSVIRIVYFVLNYVFFIAAPLLTSSLILSLIGDLSDQFRCWIYSGRKYHVFSELNGNTLHLAEKIKKAHPKEMLVFCNAKDAVKEQVSAAKAIGAVLLYASCTGARLRIRKKQLQFYLVSSSEDVNLRHAEELICKYRDKPEGSYIINAFAESGTGIQMVENMDRGSIGVRFVDATALLCNDLLLKHPLYHLPEGRDTISVVIVGCDKMGMRMLKTISWCGAVEGYRLKIRVYDNRAELLQKKLSAQCPELMENCDVAFVTVDAQTSDLETCMLDPNRGSPDATYIAITMGDDDLNIAVAERLSRLFRHHNRYSWMPLILARIRNSTKSDVYKEQENPYLKQRRIYPFGGADDVFSEGILHQSSLENLAFAVDLCYSKLLPKKDPMSMTVKELQDYFASDELRSARNRFLQSEYNRRSSMAVALHIPVKLYSCGILPAGQNIPVPETAHCFRKTLLKEPALLDRLAQNEHLRWSRFMRSEGYSQATWEDLLHFYPVLEQKNNQDVLSKRHLCLTEWDQLDEINNKYLSLDPPVRKSFKESDYNLIRDIPDIIMLAKRMEEIPLENMV